MMKTLHARLSATSAIAAAVVLTISPAAAQDAVTTSPDPAASESTPAPAASDPAATEPTPEAPETAAPETTAEAAPAKAATTSTKASKAKAKAARTPALAKTAAAHAPAVHPVTASEPAPVPLVAEPVELVPAQPAPIAQANQPDETALAVGGGALALLLVGGAAAAMRRRRAHDDEVWDDEPMILTEHEEIHADPVSATAAPRHDPVFRSSGYVAPPLSAFSWGNGTASPVRPKPVESWAERAMRGPSPDNPSLSLKKRLKRAAFFDKRERDAAEGKATPVDADAGLPERAIDAREHEFA